MNALFIAALLLILLGLSYQMGWSRSKKLAAAEGESMHSRPVYHGAFVAIWALLPALVVFGLWALFARSASDSYIISQLPPETSSLAQGEVTSAKLPPVCTQHELPSARVPSGASKSGLASLA